ncbi:MAG: hypothetical protein AAB803_03120, partial [Patescibacteria group bacterium]
APGWITVISTTEVQMAATYEEHRTRWTRIREATVHKFHLALHRERGENLPKRLALTDDMANLEAELTSLGLDPGYIRSVHNAQDEGHLPHTYLPTSGTDQG